MTFTGLSLLGQLSSPMIWSLSGSCHANGGMVNLWPAVIHSQTEDNQGV